MTYNTMPADNTAVAPALATAFPVPSSYLTIDVTPQIAAALASNSSGTASLRLSTATAQTIALCSAYAYGNARPQLLIQTTNAPLIRAHRAHASIPRASIPGSSILFNAAVTAIPARVGYVTTQWSQVSGPGTATFSSSGPTSTSVSFPAPGDYGIRITANDGVLQSFVDTTVRVLTADTVGPTDNLPLRLAFDETSGHHGR